VRFDPSALYISLDPLKFMIGEPLRNNTGLLDGGAAQGRIHAEEQSGQTCTWPETTTWQVMSTPRHHVVADFIEMMKRFKVSFFLAR
jgi:hypothetical protein